MDTDSNGACCLVKAKTHMPYISIGYVLLMQLFSLADACMLCPHTSVDQVALELLSDVIGTSVKLSRQIRFTFKTFKLRAANMAITPTIAL